MSVMRLSPTLSFYIGKQFITGIAIVFLVFVVTIFIFDAVELLRRGSGANKEFATVGLMLQMALLRIPFMAQKVLPFAALVGGLWTFTRLTKNHELVVARAAGVSAWQFLVPVLALALILGTFTITVFNPMSAAMVNRYEQMDARYLGGKSSLLALSQSGIWLRQTDTEVQSVVHARRISEDDVTLHDVIIFSFLKDDQFINRIDAEEATLSKGSWKLSEAVITGPDQPAAFHDTYLLPTSLTFDQIEDSFDPPETL